MRIKKPLYIVLMLLFSYSIVYSSPSKKTPPLLAENGVIDLRRQTFSKEISLDGQWIFYWDQYGYEAAKKMRASGITLPIIALTEVEDQVKETGMNDIVVKPFLPDELIPENIALYLISIFMKASQIIDVDQYIITFPEDTQKLLQQLRTAIRKAAPEAEEVISYQIPAYKYHGMLVYFAGYKKHIGFYPTAAGIAAFKDDLSVYKNAKGSVQFPLDKPLPLQLITKIVAFRKQQNLEKAEIKKKK